MFPIERLVESSPRSSIKPVDVTEPVKAENAKVSNLNAAQRDTEKIMLSRLFLLLSLGGFACIDSVSKECGFYVAPSTLPGVGRGVFAGKSYKVNDVVETTVSIGFDRKLGRLCHLNSYVYGFSKDYSGIIFGAGVLYNHKSPRSVAPLFVDDSVPNEVEFHAVTDIVAGQEIYTNYGENWFIDRTEDDSFSNVQSDSVLLADLEKFGHCLTSVGIDYSNITSAGKGLFALRNYQAGEVVVIAPVLPLPRSIIEMSLETSDLVNYCFTVPRIASDLFFLPLNNAALINHQPSEAANLEVQWYDWSQRDASGTFYQSYNMSRWNLTANLQLTLEELLHSSSNALFDFAFVATRDINEGEELTVNYGSEWENSWTQYLVELRQWGMTQRNNVASTLVDSSGVSERVLQAIRTMPRFKAHIEIPLQMFPSHWLRTVAPQL